MYSSTVQRQQSVLYPRLGSGTHIINIAVKGTQNSQSIGAFVDVDQLVVQ
jgi:hypothetical protein